ncbi:MAG: DUF4203 domain-containing protein [Deltaproteobacteria bacterium]|jgi:hypothetical protein|nr:DUF4203 domain-containing protein [Deltaproteobacteria bacterium]MBW2554147.1 DUF4203 domain-containing protein [Deltaproteobacteria bacterium]MCK5185922.1 DUF4203 domain-containing protein [Deltaproteobacteria bacterium]MCK5422593.1 DUF4203 domain-containing protein [Deltaproteobacteria bacterium]NOQ85319.1 DUF4203 domain-containing protein [Deltaproteobacteria bacterium]
MLNDLELFVNRLLNIIEQFNSTLFETWPVALIVGIALCFFGFKIFRFSLFIFGFIIGATIGLGIGDIILKPWGGIIGSIIIGLLGGYGFLFLIRIAGFLAGVFIGSILGVFFLGQSAWIIIVAILSGICGLFFLNYFIMASTSCWGAMLAIGSFFRFLNLPLHEYRHMLLVSEAVLFILGLGYQVHLTRKKS